MSPPECEKSAIQDSSLYPDSKSLRRFLGMIVLDLLYHSRSEKISSTPCIPSPILVLEILSDLSSPDTFGHGWTKMYVD
ncbi:hypothetical protein SK128_008973 [Halocaridina rubra]|uniref:Uncharacterized protein n=1 Tax=Halocaridina rubra TaxID=373956 RepID=A0AAN8X214_HALRR